MEDVPVLGVAFGVVARLLGFVEVVQGEPIEQVVYLIAGVVGAAWDGGPGIFGAEELCGEEGGGGEGVSDGGPCRRKAVGMDEGEGERGVDEVGGGEVGAGGEDGGEGFGAGLDDDESVGVGRGDALGDEGRGAWVRVESEDAEASSEEFAGVAAFAGTEVEGAGWC